MIQYSIDAELPGVRSHRATIPLGCTTSDRDFLCGGTFDVSFSAPRRFCAPSFLLLNNLLPMASLAVSLLIAAPAQAGRWEVSLQATGKDTVTVNGQTTTYTWPDAAFYAGGPAICDYEPQPYEQCDYSTISATITPILTWTPDNAGDNSQPSISVVVQTYVDTGAESSDGLDPLEVDDGFNDQVLGDDDHFEFPDDGFYLWQGGFDGYHVCASWGGHWQVKQNPNAASTVKLDPVTMSASGGGEQWLASTGVSLSVTAYPVTAIPSGAILGATGNWDILVGQNCIPYLSIPGLPSSITVGWPAWTVSGDTFTSFDIGSGQDTGQAIPYPDPNANISVNPPAENPTFFWKDSNSSGTPETVSGWAILYTDAAGGLSPNPNVPPSAEIGSVSASVKVQVHRPDVYSTPEARGAGLVANPLLGTVGIDTGHMDVVSNDPSGNLFGYDLQIAVVTPDLFTQGGTAYGNWAWLQLCQLDVTQGGSGTQMAVPELDSSFPYNNGAGAANGTPGPTYDARRSKDGNLMYQEFTDSPDDGWGYLDTALSFDNNFGLYVMYEPPDAGNGINYVPMDMYKWEFEASMTRSGLSGNWTPNPPGFVKDLGSAPDPNYPSWTSKFAP